LGDFNGVQVTDINGNSASFSTYTYYTNDRMLLWGAQFTSALSTICDANGSTNTTTLQNKWVEREKQYGYMGSDVKTAIQAATALASGNDYNKALALYDYVESKYNPTGAQSGSVTAVNFIGRTVTPLSGAAKIASVSSDSSSTLVLGGIAGVAVLAAGGYFFVRKKKAI
jgi:LPXTG-motif cell wall-anchored protein